MEKQVSVSQPANPVLSRPGSGQSRIPLFLRAIRWTFPKVETLAPGVADAWFVRLFFRPIRFATPPVETAVLKEATRFTVLAGSNPVEAFQWGSGPAVLFVHGWAGRGLQFYAFVKAFVDAGYSVVSFDAPAHGLSPGKVTSILDFRDAIKALHDRIGNFHAIVAHSLGGTASLFALTEGVRAERLITLSTPASDVEILREFAARIGASQARGNYLRAYVLKNFGQPFDTLMAPHFASALQPGLPWLVVHDDRDKEVSVQSAGLLKAAYPQAAVTITSGLGHVRILRDPAVIQQCLSFVAEAVHA